MVMPAPQAPVAPAPSPEAQSGPGTVQSSSPALSPPAATAPAVPVVGAPGPASGAAPAPAAPPAPAEAEEFDLESPEGIDAAIRQIPALATAIKRREDNAGHAALQRLQRQREQEAANDEGIQADVAATLRDLGVDPTRLSPERRAGLGRLAQLRDARTAGAFAKGVADELRTRYGIPADVTLAAQPFYEERRYGDYLAAHLEAALTRQIAESDPGVLSLPAESPFARGLRAIVDREVAAELRAREVSANASLPHSIPNAPSSAQAGAARAQPSTIAEAARLYEAGEISKAEYLAASRGPQALPAGW